MKCNFTGMNPSYRVFSFVALITLMTLFNQPVLAHQDQRITLNVSNKTLKTVFHSIEEQAEIVIMYEMDAIDDNEKVSLNVKDVFLEDVLSKLFSNKSLKWNRKGNVVRIYREAPKTLGDPVVGPLVSVTGRVTDLNGNPLPGAAVLVKGSKKGTSADANGQFTIPNVEQNSTLIVKLLGYEPKEIPISGVLNLRVQLKQAVGDLDEAVVVAYNTITVRDNVGAVSVVKGKDIQNIPVRSIDKSLQGFVPGLYITNGSGQPGANVSNMVIRGISTGFEPTSGETVRNPLIVIDGIPVTQDQFQQTKGFYTTGISNPMSQINPSDIESISVLKDAAAIALYGSKASNGVILLTTKKGRTGKTSFNFRHQTDISNPLNGKSQVLSRDEYIDLLFQTYRNTDPVYWTDQQIKQDLYNNFPTTKNEAGDTVFYPASDLKNEIFRRNAPTISNELAISGGNENSNFYLNLEYTKQEGIVRGTDFDRKSLRFNFENRPAKFFKFGLNTTFSYTKQNASNPLEAASDFASWAVTSPLNPVRLDNGEFQYVYATGGAAGSYVNPVAAALYNINRSSAYRGLVKGYGELKFLKNFTWTSNVATDIMFTTTTEKDDPRLYSATYYTPPPKISVQDIRNSTVITTNTLRFDKTLGKNFATNLLLGQEAQILNFNLLGTKGYGTEQTLPYFNQLPSPGYTIKDGYNKYSRQTLASYFGQANVNYANKYVFTASIRRDGSSKFGDRQRWGTYWSVGAGWILSEEPIFKDRLPGINYLKVRGSIGAAGHSGAIDQYTRFERLSLIRYQDQYGVVPGSSPRNPDIQWEQTFSWDAGMETRILKERIGLTIDAYNKKTSKLIYTINLPTISGYKSVLSNIGDMENKGIEIGLNATIIKSAAFNWSLTGSWSTNQNKLVKANVSLAEISGAILANEEGRNFNSFYLPIWAGVNPDNGMPQWIGKDGKTSSNYAEATKQFVGKPQPDAFGSFTTTFRFRSFELSAMAYYQYGANIYDFTSQFPLQTDGSYPYANQTKSALNYWKKPGDIAENPRRMLYNPDMGNMPSTRYLYKGDYIRLQNVSFAYSFNNQLLSHIRLKSSRIFVQAHNLALWTNYKGPDPDNVSTGGATQFAYPNQRTYTIGFNATF